MPPAVSRTLGGRYQLLDAIGAGGMGIVCRGFDPMFERAVAIKLMRAEIGLEARQRFLREARSTARVRHPNIIEVYDVGETEEGEPYLVMELLEGEPLARLQERVRRLPLPRALRIAGQICDALEHAHGQGVVHRDVKPENVFLEARGGKDHVKVLDFGIAKLAQESLGLTGEGAIVGTLQYMAPEQLRNGPIDGRADQYALAGLLYTILAGRPAFVADTVPQMIHAQLTATPEPLSSLVPEALPGHVIGAIHRALEKEPSARFPSIRHFASALLGDGADGALDATAMASAPASPASPPSSGLGRSADGEFVEVPSATDQQAASIELSTLRPAPVAPTRRSEMAPYRTVVGMRTVVAAPPPMPADEPTGVLGAVASVSVEIYKRLLAYPLVALVIKWIFRLPGGLGLVALLGCVSAVGLAGLVIREIVYRDG